ncbi:hypothetical protein Moror_11274 [Moniliophthora roreri MCA 2997]|uniref:Uncharacterized protein n=1 Tax=Moniliophthora roreri (strain MCA 2997) TaxID=1381753 RepID=V2X1Q6_MONRO|nr:hypothetical protein Moror_11274 [Moniliophthora roreri MCA 2997]
MKKNYKGKKQNTFVAAFDEGEEIVNMAFATAIDEEGGTSDEAEDSEMETQIEYSDQYSQTSDEENTPDVETLSLTSGRHSSAPLRQQSITYETDNGELISEQEVEDPFHSDDRLSSPITGNDDDKESLDEEDTDDKEDELESSDESFHTVPLGDEDKENTPSEPVEAVTPPMNSTGYYPQLNPPLYLETSIYMGSGPITLVPSFPDPSVPNNFCLHALRGHHSIPLTHSTPRIIVPNPLFTWINSLDEFLAQFPDEFVKLGMIKMQYIINRARQEGLLDEPCIQNYLEMMYLAVCKPMVYEPTWLNMASTPWTDLKACGWHGMHRPELACSFTGVKTWSQLPSWVDGPPNAPPPTTSSPEPLHVPPPQGSSNITGAIIHNPTLEYTIVPTFQTGEIPVELKHSDKQFVLRRTEDPNDAPHNVTFVTGNENCISSFYNPLVTPTPPPEVA